MTLKSSDQSPFKFHYLKCRNPLWSSAKHCHGNILSPSDRTSIVAFSWDRVAASISRKGDLKSRGPAGQRNICHLNISFCLQTVCHLQTVGRIQITESQDGWGWRRLLECCQLQLLPKQGYLEQCAQAHVRAAFGDPQQGDPTASGQTILVLCHLHSTEVLLLALLDNKLFILNIASHRLLRGCRDSCLEILKNHLDLGMGTLLWVSCWSGARPDVPRGPYKPQPFYDFPSCFQ